MVSGPQAIRCLDAKVRANGLARQILGPVQIWGAECAGCSPVTERHKEATN